MSNAVATPVIADGAAPSPKGIVSQAGVRPYAAADVPGYVPAETELLRALRIRPAAGVNRFGAAVAAGSPRGTRTKIRSSQPTSPDHNNARI